MENYKSVCPNCNWENRISVTKKPMAEIDVMCGECGICYYELTDSLIDNNYCSETELTKQPNKQSHTKK